MRILAVAPYYEPEGGGLERYAHATLDRLARRGHQVRAIAFTKAGLATGRLGNVEVQRVLPRLRLGNAPVEFGFTARVADAIRAFRPDVLLAHTPVPFAAEMAYPAARRAGIPFVATYHAGRLRGSSAMLEGLAMLDRLTLERRMLAGAARLIAVGPYVRDHALRRHRAKVAVIPPGVDLARFPAAPAAQGKGILFVGPLDSGYTWKGVDVLWEAFFRLRQAVPDATLTLVGDGDRLQELRARAQGDPYIHIPGRASDAELVQHYRQAAVTVLPSTTDAESFGMVLAEANACGRPVVGSAIGGIPDFIAHGVNGLLARPDDAADLAARLQALLTDRALAERLGKAGRQKVRAHHDWDVLARRTEAVLEEACAAGVAPVAPRVAARTPPAALA